MATWSDAMDDDSVRRARPAPRRAAAPDSRPWEAAMTVRSLPVILALGLTLAAGGALAADLTLTQSGGGSATIGQSRTLVISTGSVALGLPPGTAVTVTTTLQGLGQVAASGSGWTCSIAGQNVTCSRADGLAAGGSLPPINVTAVVGSGASWSNCAEVTHAVNAAVQPDQVTGNNTACVSGTILPGRPLRRAPEAPRGPDRRIP